MTQTMKCSIVTIEAPFFEGEVFQVDINTVAGQRGILPGHEPTSVVLRDGPIIIRDNTGQRTVTILSGFAEVTANTISIMAFQATPNV